MPRYIDIEKVQQRLQDADADIEAKRVALQEAESHRAELQSAYALLNSIAEEEPETPRSSTPAPLPLESKSSGNQPDSPPQEKTGFPRGGDNLDKLTFLLGVIGHFANSTEIKKVLDKFDHDESKYFVNTNMSVYSKEEDSPLYRATVKGRGKRLFVGLPEWVQPSPSEDGTYRLAAPEFAPRSKSGAPAKEYEVTITRGTSDDEDDPGTNGQAREDVENAASEQGRTTQPEGDPLPGGI